MKKVDGPKDILATQLKNGDIIERDGSRYLVRIDGFSHKPSDGTGLNRAITIQDESDGSKGWEEFNDQEIRWVGQTDLHLDEYLNRVRTAKMTATQTKSKKPWWQFWKSS